jgi:hypothetical protein
MAVGEYNNQLKGDNRNSNAIVAAVAAAIAIAISATDGIAVK